MHPLDWIELWFAKYGYGVLLIGLPLDAIALPLPPGNTTLTYTGYLSYKGVLRLVPAVAAAYTGAIAGMTITYAIGYKLGQPLIERYGKWLFLKPEHLEKTKAAYEKHGNKILLFSFFMPGVRQFIGYFAGIIRVPFRTFACYAYAGAALWVAAFVGIGYAFGDQWQLVFQGVERYLKVVWIALAAVLAGVLFLRWRRRRRRIREAADRRL
ncbi:DedA family protein [Cohnella nanjingensis]|uniref:DedA family protein n=1 Tax=Cohnella nanjingensis TaxID=1387779 RepID=A0A7X0RZI6_9BACL|nr:DedA family protein [Cohnella nanjingensis]MBB6675165.1 DedA family protein [Cohnella nanjingensis]